ncbi:transcriptional repressor general negative regulator of transcription subunit 4 [Massospora cicadina]|nr:transcriptional repressor general negative regulator of transcription subunit 4 [Massospora cicadina]
MSDSEIFEECPLCLEEIDILDSNFKPCPCGYQVLWLKVQLANLAAQICVFCYEKIGSGDTRCPACRRTYTEDGIQNDPVTPKQIARAKARKSQRGGHADLEHGERKLLTSSRVEQKNLVYVLGFSNKYCNPELLRKNDYFGQFGTITKLIISPRGKVEKQPSFAVYVTYSTPEEAARAIYALDGCEVDGKVLKACYGTTKYCANFLKHIPCTNPTCLYLHEIRVSDLAASTSKWAYLATSRHLSFSHQSSGVKRSERRSNVSRGYGTSAKDLRGSALPATASWAKGVTSGPDVGTKAASAARDFPALLPAHTDSSKPKSNKRKGRHESSHGFSSRNKQSVSPAPNPFEDLDIQTGAALDAGTKIRAPAEVSGILPDPLSEDDLVYSSEEKAFSVEELEPSDYEDDTDLSRCKPSAFRRLPLPRFTISFHRRCGSYGGFCAKLPRLEFGRTHRAEEAGYSRFSFAKPRCERVTTPPDLSAMSLQAWDADRYVDGLLNSPELPRYDYGANISLQDLFQAAAIANHLPTQSHTQQLPPKQKPGSRFFKTKPPPSHYPRHIADGPPMVYPADFEKDEGAPYRRPPFDTTFSASRPPLSDLSPSHLYGSQPRFFPVPDEPSILHPPHSESIQDPSEVPKGNVKAPLHQLPIHATEPHKESRSRSNPILQFAPSGLEPRSEPVPLLPLKPHEGSSNLSLEQVLPPQVCAEHDDAAIPAEPEAPTNIPEITPAVEPEVPTNILEITSAVEPEGSVSVPESTPAVKPEEPTSIPAVALAEKGPVSVEAPVQEVAPRVELPRPATPPMPKLAFDHFPAFRPSLDKCLSDSHRLLIQRELSSVYSLLQAAIENKPEPCDSATPFDEKLAQLEAKAATFQSTPLPEFTPLTAQRMLMNEAQLALQEVTTLGAHLQRLSAIFSCSFDFNFEV